MPRRSRRSSFYSSSPPPAQGWETSDPAEALGLLTRVRRRPRRDILGPGSRNTRRSKSFSGTPEDLAGSARSRAGQAPPAFLPPRLPSPFEPPRGDILSGDPARSLSCRRAPRIRRSRRNSSLPGEWKFEGTARFARLTLRDPENRFLIEISRAKSRLPRPRPARRPERSRPLLEAFPGGALKPGASSSWARSKPSRPGPHRRACSPRGESRETPSGTGPRGPGLRVAPRRVPLRSTLVPLRDRTR